MSDENRQTMHCLSKDTLIDMIHDLGTKFAQAHREGWEQCQREAIDICVNGFKRGLGDKFQGDVFADAIASMSYDVANDVHLEYKEAQDESV